MTNQAHTHVEVRAGAYADSVTLLRVSRDVAATDGVLAAQVAMATALNLEVLHGMGFEVPPATPNDMVVALRLESADATRLQHRVDIGGRCHVVVGLGDGLVHDADVEVLGDLVWWRRRDEPTAHPRDASLRRIGRDDRPRPRTGRRPRPSRPR